MADAPNQLTARHHGTEFHKGTMRRRQFASGGDSAIRQIVGKCMEGFCRILREPISDRIRVFANVALRCAASWCHQRNPDSADAATCGSPASDRQFGRSPDWPRTGRRQRPPARRTAAGRRAPDRGERTRDVDRRRHDPARRDHEHPPRRLRCCPEIAGRSHPGRCRPHSRPEWRASTTSRAMKIPMPTPRLRSGQAAETGYRGGRSTRRQPLCTATALHAAAGSTGVRTIPAVGADTRCADSTCSPFFQVRAEVPTVYPDLKRAPGHGEILRLPVRSVRVVHERDLDGERAGVAGQAFPMNGHNLIPVPPDIPALDEPPAAPSSPELGRDCLPPEPQHVMLLPSLGTGRPDRRDR